MTQTRTTRAAAGLSIDYEDPSGANALTEPNYRSYGPVSNGAKRSVLTHAPSISRLYR